MSRDDRGSPFRAAAVDASSLADPDREESIARLRRLRRRPVSARGRLRAAVALVLRPDAAGRLSLLLTRRSAHLRRHRGQFALPGGRLDPGERVLGAARRELREELGLDLPASAALGRLDDYPTRSGFVISPVVLWTDERSALSPDAREVAQVYEVPLYTLEREDTPRLTRIEQSEQPVLSLDIGGHWVHAPTAAIVYQLFELLYRQRVVRVAHFEQPLFAWR